MHFTENAGGVLEQRLMVPEIVKTMPDVVRLSKEEIAEIATELGFVVEYETAEDGVPVMFIYKPGEWHNSEGLRIYGEPYLTTDLTSDREVRELILSWEIFGYSESADNLGGPLGVFGRDWFGFYVHRDIVEVLKQKYDLPSVTIPLPEDVRLVPTWLPRTPRQYRISYDVHIVS